MTPTHPKFPSFAWDWEGAQKCFIPRDQTTGDLKSHHLQTPVTLTALSVPPRPPFLSAELCVIRYHISNLSQLCITIYILAISYNARKKFFFVFLRALTASWGGGTCPPGPPLGPALKGAFKQTAQYDHSC